MKKVLIAMDGSKESLFALKREYKIKEFFMIIRIFIVTKTFFTFRFAVLYSV